MTLRSPRAGALAAAGLALSISAALGHDEDYRKTLDRMAPVTGPVWTLGDPVTLGGGFNASGVTLLSHIPLNNFSGNHNLGNDCWGYVSPSGREYAIMGLERGFGFVEITDPTNPVIIASIPGPQSDWHDVKVIGEYAYGVSEGGSGIQVMDLRQIDSGSVTLVRNFTNGGNHQTTHNIVSNPDAGTLFLVGANIGNGGLINLDLSDPTRPTIDGGWTEMYVHDAQVVSYDEGPYAGREIAYLASGFDNGFTSTGLRIVDVTDKSNMFTIATLFYPNAVYAHQVWLSEDKQTLYLNDEIDELNGLVSVTTTRIIDVSDPGSPQLVGTSTNGRPSVDHNLYTHDNLMFQSNYRSGLRVFDIGDPRNPTEIGFFDTFPNSDAASFNGAWSNYPYFPSGTVIVSDIERGLFVLRVDVAPSPRLRLTAPLGTPGVFSPEGGDELFADVTEIELDADESSVRLLIDAGGPEPVAVQGTPVAERPGRYRFQTPALPCDSSPRYWFSASSTGGTEFTFPSDAPSQAFEADVISDEVVAFADDFQTNRGWTTSGDAGDGGWTRGVPVGGGDRGDPGTDFDGSGACFLTDNEDGNSDVDGGSVVLTSPTLDAAGGDTYIEYARWFNNSAGAAPGEDTFVVEVSNNNGSSWTTLETVGPGGTEVNGGWNLVRFRLRDVFANPSSQFRVRFTASDLINGSVVEAGVDAVRVFDLICEDAPSCPADFNGDGSVNVLDVVAFIGVWNDNGEGSDFNGDGSINVLDVVDFIGVWNAGCP